MRCFFRNSRVRGEEALFVARNGVSIRTFPDRLSLSRAHFIAETAKTFIVASLDQAFAFNVRCIHFYRFSTTSTSASTTYARTQSLYDSVIHHKSARLTLLINQSPNHPRRRSDHGASSLPRAYCVSHRFRHSSTEPDFGRWLSMRMSPCGHHLDPFAVTD